MTFFCMESIRRKHICAKTHSRDVALRAQADSEGSAPSQPDVLELKVFGWFRHMLCSAGSLVNIIKMVPASPPPSSLSGSPDPSVFRLSRQLWEKEQSRSSASYFFCLCLCIKIESFWVSVKYQKKNASKQLDVCLTMLLFQTRQIWEMRTSRPSTSWKISSTGIEK